MEVCGQDEEGRAKWQVSCKIKEPSHSLNGPMDSCTPPSGSGIAHSLLCHLVSDHFPEPFLEWPHPRFKLGLSSLVGNAKVPTSLSVSSVWLELCSMVWVVQRPSCL